MGALVSFAFAAITPLLRRKKCTALIMRACVYDEHILSDMSRMAEHEWASSKSPVISQIRALAPHFG